MKRYEFEQTSRFEMGFLIRDTKRGSEGVSERFGERAVARAKDVDDAILICRLLNKHDEEQHANR